MILRRDFTRSRQTLGLFILALSFLSLGFAFSSCSKGAETYAYTGRMDADTITLSAKVSGEIIALSVNEGDGVRQGQLLGQMETDRLQTQRAQEEAQLAELEARHQGVEAQLQEAQEELKLSKDTLAKTEKVLGEGGATVQRRDELATQLQVGEKNLEALDFSLKAIEAQERQSQAVIKLTDLSLKDAMIVSPIDGVVVDKFHSKGELAAVGTPLLELADLSVLAVEVYLPLEALGKVAIGQKASVYLQNDKEGIPALVSWISSEAEFTPKTILTQETRPTLVYGVKLRVRNADGRLKIGMPVDVRF